MPPLEKSEEFTPALQALFLSHSLGMFYDRTQACPTIDERDPLDPYLEVGGDEVYLAMDDSSTTEKEPEVTCYWVIRPERDLWQPELSQISI